MKINNFIFYIFIFFLFIFTPKISISATVCPNGLNVFFSPDKSWYVCHLQIEEKNSLAINGEVKSLYDWVGSPGFSLDSKKLAYKARVENEWFVVSGTKGGLEKKGKSYDEIESVIWNLDIFNVRFFVFGPSGTLSYLARDGDKWFVVSGDKESPAYDWARPIIFSDNGLNLSYKARFGDEWFVVVNDKKQKSYDWVGFPVWSSDSKKFAYKARLGDEWFVVVNDKKQKSYEEIISISPNPNYRDFDMVTFSSGSNDVVYGAKKGDKWMVVVGQSEGLNYDEISFSSTFYSNSISYRGMKDGVWFEVSENQDRTVKKSVLVQKETVKLANEFTFVAKSKVKDLDSVFMEFQEANNLMRSLASRMETRLDKLMEKEARDDKKLRDALLDIRLVIHQSEEAVKKAKGASVNLPVDYGLVKNNLKLSKKNLFLARQKFYNLINQVRR